MAPNGIATPITGNGHRSGRFVFRRQDVVKVPFGKGARRAANLVSPDAKPCLLQRRRWYYTSRYWIKQTKFPRFLKRDIFNHRRGDPDRVAGRAQHGERPLLQDDGHNRPPGGLGGSIQSLMVRHRRRWHHPRVRKTKQNKKQLTNELTRFWSIPYRLDCFIGFESCGNS